MNYTPETVCSALSSALDADEQGCGLGFVREYIWLRIRHGQ